MPLSSVAGASWAGMHLLTVCAQFARENLVHNLGQIMDSHVIRRRFVFNSLKEGGDAQGRWLVEAFFRGFLPRRSVAHNSYQDPIGSQSFHMYIFGDLQLRPFSYIFTIFLLLVSRQQKYCNISWDKSTRRGLPPRALIGRPNQMPDYVKSRNCGGGKRGHRVLAYSLFVSM